jgi:Dolichyl-phosphate-mannose-protein mannosyltransferase
LFVLFAAVLIASHIPLLRLPYFWDEAGYYVPAARDLLAGSLIPQSTPSNAHPPLVMAWIALSWKIFGYSPTVTRVAMLVLAAFALLGFFRLARTVSNATVAAAAALVTAAYPVFFAQSSLAQVDLPAAGLIFWGLESSLRQRRGAMVLWFSLAALAKETAILVPFALFWGELASWLITRRGVPQFVGSSTREGTASSRAVDRAKDVFTARLEARPSRSFHGGFWSDNVLRLFPTLPLAFWYAYHYARTGFVFGNPEFFRYNVQGTLHPLRILLALLLRIWQAVGYMNLYVLTLACVLALWHAPKQDSSGEKQRIAAAIQLTFLAIAVFYGGALAVIGGAVLARYMLPIVPLVILVCVSTIWRRLRLWKPVIAVVVLAFIAALFVNPPYGFAPEDNLAYRDYIRLHQQAETFLLRRYPNARVLTAWPASGELTQPYVGYVAHPMPLAQIVQIEDFTAEHLLGAADLRSEPRSDGSSERSPEARSRFDVVLVFSTKYQPPPNIFDRWQLWQEWKARYFGFHRDLTPEAAASLLGGRLVYVEYRHWQWVGIIQIGKTKETKLRTLYLGLHLMAQTTG